MEPVVDLRVVRGPDWEYGDEDGGEGHLGTVVEVQRSSASAAVTEEEVDPAASPEPAEPEGVACTVTVQWDCGHRSQYRCGSEGKYDLRVFDNGQTGMKHRNITCDGCRASEGVIGMRWKCSRCYDFDLCTHCYMANKHSLDHKFVRCVNEKLRSMVPCRRSARVVQAMGLFPPAEVVRGYDWSWGQQDGGCGNVGKVTGISNWESTNYRASVEVEWPDSGERNEYRVGFHGMVDIKCVTPASGGNFYPDHLPVLGAPHCPAGPSEFACTDYVSVNLDSEVFQLMQEGHGGWNPAMDNIRGEIGTVHCILDSGDLRVVYGERIWTLNPSAVVKADIPHFVPGDGVRIMDDLGEVAKLQKFHGGWNEEMASAIGQLGTVQGVNNEGNVIVYVKGQIWTFSPLCIKLAEKEETQEVTDTTVLGEETAILELRMQALLQDDDSEVLAHAALLGNVSVIRDYLDKYPNEVDAKYCNKTALHCAAAAGKVSVVEALLELQANVESKDEEGYTPLHHCAIRDEAEVATLLLKAGADPNSKSKIEHTPLTIAAIKGNLKVLSVLLQCSSVRLFEPDKDGDTALHCAVHGRMYQSVRKLLESGADPSLVNFNILSPLHLAVKVGFLPAVESILHHHPEHVNVKDGIGCTPLHLAAGEGEIAVAKVILENEQCLVDARADTGHTPLHGAIMKDHSRMVELLVGYGADPTITESDGETALHLAMNNEDLNSPSDATVELNKVKKMLVEMSSTEPSGQLVVACFLIQEGADVTTKNHNGQTPLDLCSPEMAVIAAAFSERATRSGFRGSLHPSAPKESPNHKKNFPHNTDNQRLATTEGPSLPSESNENQKFAGEKTRNQTLNTQQSANQSQATTSPITGVQERPILSTGGTAELCFLCDTPIRVKFEPCGHSPVCEYCARRAKKCPECKTPVQHISELPV